MAEAVCQRVREQRTRQEEPANEASSSSESKENLVKELSSSSMLEEDPVTLSSSSLEGEYEGTTTPSRPDDDPNSSPALACRIITRSMPKKPMLRPKRKAYKMRTTKPGISSRKCSRG